MSKIKIGLPSKGRLKDESLAFLKSKNLQVVNSFGKRNSKIIELARGGEYNGLLRTLGYKRDIPAIGGAINLNELINL